MGVSNLHIYIPLLLLHLTQTGTLSAFSIARLASGSMTHQLITKEAILDSVSDVCRSLMKQKKMDFMLPKGPLSMESLATACLFTSSLLEFEHSIHVISGYNVMVDIIHPSKEYHFDDEMFVKGQELIIKGLNAIKADVNQGNFFEAQRTLGGVMHTLQDFYSHSDWIELGNKLPYSNIIKPGRTIANIADASTSTCSECIDGNCENNILKNVITKGKLTSGYFKITLHKQRGKCTHGGIMDVTWDGINKDDMNSPHKNLHMTAAKVAIHATKELLQDVREAVGDDSFLRLLEITRNSYSSSILCLVVDTSANLAHVLPNLKKVANSIVNKAFNKPSVYVLVPYDNQGAGPLLRTTDSAKFLSELSELSTSGQEENSTPSQSLSGIRLALSAAPISSQIFVFTDAPPGDAHLNSSVLALIENTKSEVNFMLTNADVRSEALSTELFRSLSQSSGGQAIEITDRQFNAASGLIADSLHPNQVTLFQVVRDPGKVETFSFLVDSLVANVTLHITGHCSAFTLRAPNGSSQTSRQSGGSLAAIRKLGNFKWVQLHSPHQTGPWEINMRTLQPYSIKVIGESAMDFFFDFLDPQQGVATLKSRPTTFGNISLSVSVINGSSVNVTDVALVQVSGSDVVCGTIEKFDNDSYVVNMTRAPGGPFYVRLRGEMLGVFEGPANAAFHRQSDTQFQSSAIAILAEDDHLWEPGKTINVTFSVLLRNSTAVAEELRVGVWDDHGFSSSFPSSLVVLAGDDAAKGNVTLTAPPNTPSGTAVTLVIEVHSLKASDSNYIILRLSVISWHLRTDRRWVLFLVLFIICLISLFKFVVALNSKVPKFKAYLSFQGYEPLDKNSCDSIRKRRRMIILIIAIIIILFSALILLSVECFFMMFFYR